MRPLELIEIAEMKRYRGVRVCLRSIQDAAKRCKDLCSFPFDQERKPAAIEDYLQSIEGDCNNVRQVLKMMAEFEKRKQ